MFFSNSPEVQTEDLLWIIRHTAKGDLEWGRAPSGRAAIGTNVRRRMGEATVSAMNISEVCIGFVPPTNTTLNYLTIKDAAEQRHDIDPQIETRSDVLAIAARTLYVALLAVRSQDGVINASGVDCATCQIQTPHLNTYSAPHGIEGAMLSGTERCECAYCGEATVVAVV